LTTTTIVWPALPRTTNHFSDRIPLSVLCPWPLYAPNSKVIRMGHARVPDVYVAVASTAVAREAGVL